MLDDTVENEKNLSSTLSKLGHDAVNVEIGNKISERDLLFIQAEIEKETKKILKEKHTTLYMKS